MNRIGCLDKDNLRPVLGPGAQVKTSKWYQYCWQNYVHMYVCICTHFCVCVLDPFIEFRGGVRDRVRVRVRVRVTGVAVGSLYPSNPPGRPASRKKKG